MLNVGQLNEGVVLDHIKAGKSMTIYHDLKLDKLDCCVAIIKNARSAKMGRKDIIKVECPIDTLNLDILGFIDHNITVNIIKDGKIVEKKELHLPKKLKMLSGAKIRVVLLLWNRSWIRFSSWQIRRRKFTGANIVRKNTEEAEISNLLQALEHQVPVLS